MTYHLTSIGGTMQAEVKKLYDPTDDNGNHAVFLGEIIEGREHWIVSLYGHGCACLDRSFYPDWDAVLDAVNSTPLTFVKAHIPT